MAIFCLPFNVNFFRNETNYGATLQNLLQVPAVLPPNTDY